MIYFKYGLCAAILVLLCVPAWAINKCTQPDGKVSFQDAPCIVSNSKTRDDLADAKRDAGGAVQSGKAIAANLQAQFEAEQKKKSAVSAQVNQPNLAPDTASAVVMSFRQCNSTVDATILSLGVSWKDVRRIVNSAEMSMTKICTNDGSVLITCSAPDSKMITTRGSICS